MVVGIVSIITRYVRHVILPILNPILLNPVSIWLLIKSNKTSIITIVCNVLQPLLRWVNKLITLDTTTDSTVTRSTFRVSCAFDRRAELGASGTCSTARPFRLLLRLVNIPI